MVDKFILVNKYYHITVVKNSIIIFDPVKNKNISEYIFPCLYLNFIENKNDILIKIFIKKEFFKYKKSKCLLNTFYRQLKRKIFGLVSLYKGSITIRGFNFRLDVIIKNNRSYLYFFFGLKYSKNFLIPNDINVDFVEKFRVGLSSHNFQLLHLFKLNVQKICYPSVYKIKGIFFDDIFPKPKKFEK